jgi:predicted NAD-dependent protein-ADP-ribosyltransferase YbiA (DUF1768 family)
VDGVVYPSAEHFMMTAKARLFGDEEAAGRIMAAAHPGQAKALGRQVRGFDEQRWAGLAADAPHATSPRHWSGLNLLGFALMEVRQQLSTSRHDHCVAN